MLRPEYIIKRSGKDYVLYPGLLNEAHQMYVSFSLLTEILERGDQPLVKATFVGWIEGTEYPLMTQGHGRAGRPSDKSGAAAEAPLEMAETRAKARALRDAVNIGETAFEELSSSGDEPSVDAPPRTSRHSGAHSGAHSVAHSVAHSGAHSVARAHEPKRANARREKISEETLEELKVMLSEDAKYKDVSLENRITALEDHQGYPLDQMSEQTARGWIAQFEQMLRHRKEIDQSSA